MANKKKYESAKPKAWYADTRAVEVLDVLREEKRRETGAEKEVTRSNFINEWLIDVGIKKGIIKQPKPEIPGAPPELGTIKAKLDELQKMLKDLGEGSDSKRGSTA